MSTLPVRDTTVSNRELAIFFLITIFVSWGYVVFSGPMPQPGIGDIEARRWYQAQAIVIIWIPMSAALICTALFRGKEGLIQIARRFLPFGVKPQFWILALLVPIALLVPSIFVSGGFSEYSARQMLDTWLGMFAFLMLIMIGEELGWRGYALPALQARMSAFSATLLLGCLWGLWHYPAWFGLVYGGSGEISGAIAAITVLTVSIIAMAFVLTWFANLTGASILVATMYHASNNAALRLCGYGDSTTPTLVSVAVTLVAAVLLVSFNRSMYFSRPVVQPEASPDRSA